MNVNLRNKLCTIADIFCIRKMISRVLMCNRQLIARRCRRNVKRIEQKIKASITQTNRPIRIAFLVTSRPQWGMQSIYDACAASEAFDPCILVANDSISGHAVQETVSFFEDKGIHCSTELNLHKLPDVILVPYHLKRCLGGVEIDKLYHKALIGCCLYSWNLSNADEVYFQHLGFASMWRHFVFNEREMSAAENSPYTHGENAVCIGFPRNDEVRAVAPWNGWRLKNSLKIIWAPHWSIKTHSRLGNFDRYAFQMLDWVRKHPEVEVVYKPHPMLKPRLCDEKSKSMFRKLDADFEDVIEWNTEKYDFFMKEWQSLPNALIMDDANYMGLFQTSDAMVLDSISFIAEYMVLDKPMCFCNRDRTHEELAGVFNDTGKALLSGMTIADDWMGVEDFLESILNYIDNHAAVRKDLADRYLLLNKGHVGTLIAEHIASALGRKYEA